MKHMLKCYPALGQQNKKAEIKGQTDLHAKIKAPLFFLFTPKFGIEILKVTT